MSENTSAPKVDAQTESNPGQENQPVQESQSLTPRMIKSLKLKIDGQEFDEQLPFEIDENDPKQVEFLKRHLQMSKVSNKRMSEAAMTKKQAEQFIQALQNDPMKILSNPKLMGEEKFQKIAEEFLAKKIQDQMLSPEERRQIEMQKRLEEYEAKEKSEKERIEAEETEKMQLHYAQEFEKTIVDGLKESNLPKNTFTVKRMAELMKKNLQHGLELSPSQLATMVKEDYQKELVSLIGGSEADQILALFGDELSNKIRKYDLAKFKQNNSNQAKPQNLESNMEQPQRKMRPHEYNEWLKRRNS